MVAVILLSKIVKAIGVLCSIENASLPLDQRKAALDASPHYDGSPDWPVCQTFGQFSAGHAVVLVERFSVLDRMLEREQKATEVTTEEAWLQQRGGRSTKWASVRQPSFRRDAWPEWESRPLRTTHCVMPAMSVHEFVESWGGATCNL